VKLALLPDLPLQNSAAAQAQAQAQAQSQAAAQQQQQQQSTQSAQGAQVPGQQQTGTPPQ